MSSTSRRLPRAATPVTITMALAAVALLSACSTNPVIPQGPATENTSTPEPSPTATAETPELETGQVLVGHAVLTLPEGWETQVRQEFTDTDDAGNDVFHTEVSLVSATGEIAVTVVNSSDVLSADCSAYAVDILATEPGAPALDGTEIVTIYGDGIRGSRMVLTEDPETNCFEAVRAPEHGIGSLSVIVEPLPTAPDRAGVESWIGSVGYDELVALLQSAAPAPSN